MKETLILERTQGGKTNGSQKGSNTLLRASNYAVMYLRRRLRLSTKNLRKSDGDKNEKRLDRARIQDGAANGGRPSGVAHSGPMQSAGGAVMEKE
jgi:hypothetical protein